MKLEEAIDNCLHVDEFINSLTPQEFLECFLDLFSKETIDEYVTCYYHDRYEKFLKAKLNDKN